jgi:hypothetical protein
VHVPDGRLQLTPCRNSPRSDGISHAPADFVVHIWTPGNQPMQIDPEIAVPVAPGVKLVMQIHYHPAGRTHAPGRTGIDLRFSRRWPRRMYFVIPVGTRPQRRSVCRAQATSTCRGS